MRIANIIPTISLVCIPLAAVVVQELAFAAALQAADNGMASRQQLFNQGWCFHRGDVTNGAQASVDDQDWQRVTLPHDWGIESSFRWDMPRQGQPQAFLDAWDVGWYRKRFTLNPEDRQRQWLLQFDGVFRDSEVWLNGHKIGGHPYGYVGFFVDLNEHANFNGENLLAVRVDHTMLPSDRWYSGAGIYRHVWLINTDKVRIMPWGVFVTTPIVKPDRAAVKVNIRLTNGSAEPKAIRLLNEVLLPDGQVCARDEATAMLPTGKAVELTQTLNVANPVLWSVETPTLCTLRSTLLTGENERDRVLTPFGIREIRFEARKGFFLNGQPMKFKGVNLHHTLGCLGSASLDRSWERSLEVLKGMGCNAIRTSHNPPSAEMLDLCDRMGFLVIDEAFDKWKWKDGYYKHHFDQWWKQDLDAMLLRDRNHPSVVIWSVGNEVEFQGEPSMLELLGMLAEHTRKMDPTRPVTFALEPHCNPASLGDAPVAEKVRRTLAMAAKVDLLALNYHEQWYADYHQADPDLLMLGSEAYSYYRGRGNEFAAFEEKNPWFDVVANDYVLGQFLWAGIDYLGESQPWPSKGWASAPIDTAGFRKPHSWYHQSVWSETPMVRLAVFDDMKREPRQRPHWSWPALSAHWNFAGRENLVLRVAVFANCEEVELSLNGKSLGRKALAEFPNRVMLWNIPYEAGTLKAAGFKGGKVVCRHELRTAGKPARIALVPDRTTLKADGQQLSHVEVRIEDEDGNLVPDADRTLFFAVKGAVRLAGVDNGDLDSSESYVGAQRTTYIGRCLAVIRALSEPGPVELTVTGEGLPAASVKIEVLAAESESTK